MRLIRTSLLTAALAGMCAFFHVNAAHAQDAGDDPTKPAADEPAADKPDDKPADDPPAPKPADDDDGTWGRGGKEAEGRFVPKGKTGKLKEIEEEEAERRSAKTGKPDLPPPGHAMLDTALGFGDLRVVTSPTGTTDVTPTASFLIDLGYRIGDTWNIGLRFPVSTGVVEGPLEPFATQARDPDNFKRIAIGGIEVSVMPHFIINRDLRIPAGIALTVPTAAGDLNAGPDDRADIGDAIVNQAASASRGWEDQALFAHQRFGITPRAGVLYDTEVGPGKLHVGADTKVEIMIKTGGNDPPTVDQLGPAEEPGETRGVAVNWVLRAQAFYDLLGGYVSPGAKLWLSVHTARDIKGSQDYGGPQLALEPGVQTHIPFTDDKKGFGMKARLGYMIPLGMHLGGADDASIGGLRIGAGFVF